MSKKILQRVILMRMRTMRMILCGVLWRDEHCVLSVKKIVHLRDVYRCLESL